MMLKNLWLAELENDDFLKDEEYAFLLWGEKTECTICFAFEE